MNEAGVEIVKTEETKESKIKYLNINVSDSEVERNPDIVRLCADAGVLEYVKPKTGHWYRKHSWEICFTCSKCETTNASGTQYNYCPSCGARMVEREG